MRILQTVASATRLSILRRLFYDVVAKWLSIRSIGYLLILSGALTPARIAKAQNCGFSEGQFLFNFYGEQIYAHYYNGVLYASYQNASQGFKAQSWMQQAAGVVGFDQSRVSCFAQNDPHSSGPPTSNPPSNPPSANCSFSEGQFLFNFYGEQIYAHYYNGVLFASYQNPSQGFKPQSWLLAAGYDASKLSCFAQNDPHTSNPPTSNPPTSNPPSGNCSFQEGQFLFNFYGEQIYAHYYNGVLYASYQDPSQGFKSQSWMQQAGGAVGFDPNKVSCFAQTDPHTSSPPTSNPPTSNPPSGTCSYSEGQFLFNFNTEQIYAHYYNGVLYASYQNPSQGFKTRTWLQAAGYDVSKSNCFAQNDPHSSTGGTTNPPTNPTNQPNLPRAGSNFAGNLDGADCGGITGWALNRNTPNQSIKIDIYINGQLAYQNVTANKSRQDVANAFGISGYNAFGFIVPFPSNFRAGVPLKVLVKYAGTSTNISGCPKTTETCQSGMVVNSFWEGSGDCEQTSLPGSGKARSTASARTGTTSFQLNAGSSRTVASLTSQLIPVKQGANLSVDAYAFAPALSKRNLTPQLTTAVVGGVLAGVALTRQQAVTSDQRCTTNLVPTLGVSSALILPLVKSLLANRLPKAGIELAFYNKQGKFVHRQPLNITKLAREGWQLLHIQGCAPQDGYAVVRLHNYSKAPVFFDDIRFAATPNPGPAIAGATASYPAPVGWMNGFASQVRADETTVLLSGGCGGGGEYKPQPSDGIPLPINPTVTAPRYKDPNDSNSDYPNPPTNTDPTDSGDPGGNGGQTNNPVDPNRAVTKTFAKKLTTVCQGLKKLWEWSYQNNNAATTVEMGGYVLADGTFVVLPWVNNTGTNIQFYSGGSTFLADNGHQYSIIVPAGGPNKGVPILRDEDLITNPQNPPYTDTPIVSYVHTHPWTDASHDSYNPTASTNGQEYGDWQLSKDFGIPGKIIVSNTIVNFHYDSSQSNHRAKDADESLNTICP